jgi:predicted ester cyclase
MPISPNELSRRIIEEIYNQGNLDLVYELYSPDIVREVLPMPPIVGQEAVRQYVQDTRAAFPDLHIEIEQTLMAGPRTATSFVLIGTHSGESPIMPVPPTGKKVRMRGVVIGLTQDGRRVSEVAYHDTFGLMQQIGVIPGPPQA